MRRPIKIYLIYIVALMAFSVLFKKIGVESDLEITLDNRVGLLNPMVLITILGGMLALRLTVSSRSFYYFLAAYLGLWALRYFMLFLGDQIGELKIMGKVYRLKYIIPNYYANVSKLATPFPFILYWLVNYLFAQKENIKVKFTK
jgi:hypothetical protein